MELNSMKRDKPASLLRIKSQHLRKRANEALSSGNSRDAWQLLTECLKIAPDKASANQVLLDRCHAFVAGGRHESGLADAEGVLSYCPELWKAHEQKGLALMGLKKFQLAAQSLAAAQKCSEDSSRGQKMMKSCINHMTQEEVGEGILDILCLEESKGNIPQMKEESPTEHEMKEATYKVVHASEKMGIGVTNYRNMYGKWLVTGIPPYRALIERSRIAATTKCYAQARVDAILAIQQIENMGVNASSGDGRLFKELRLAWAHLGDALFAEDDHPDRDIGQAIKWYTKCTDDSLEKVEEFDKRLREAGRKLSGPDLDKILTDICNIKGSKGRWQVRGSLDFSDASITDFTSNARSLLRQGVSFSGKIPCTKVSIERVAPRRVKTGIKGVCIDFEADFGDDLQGAEDFVNRAKKSRTIPWRISAKNEFEQPADLPPGHLEVAPASLIESNLGALSNVTWGPGGLNIIDMSEDSTSGSQDLPLNHPERSTSLVTRSPRLELMMPYKYYKLVYSDGRRVERKDKHPFCMSRVFYFPEEVGPEIWVEMCDGSCRWRQSSSEVKVMVLKVPDDLQPGSLKVVFEPEYIQVWNHTTREVYLEGDLERGIIPEECTWTHCHGKGEEGCMLYLQKMNLELVVNPKMHSEMWWPRLLTCHPEIAWDDYEKDYSDLPKDILNEHQIQEEAQNEIKQLEKMEKEERDALQERDNKRKRRRQEKLHKLRTGKTVDWVHLTSYNKLPTPSQTKNQVDRFGHKI